MARCRLGNERWLDALPWSNATEFQTAKEETWVVNGTEAGSVRSASGLSFVKVADAVRQRASVSAFEHKYVAILQTYFNMVAGSLRFSIDGMRRVIIMA